LDHGHLRDHNLGAKALGRGIWNRGQWVAKTIPTTVPTRLSPIKANTYVQLSVLVAVVVAVNALYRQVPSNVGLDQLASTASVDNNISTLIIAPLFVHVKPDGSVGIGVIGNKAGSVGFIFQQHLGVALTSPGIATVRRNVPTGIVAIRVEVDGTIQTEGHVTAFGACGTGQGCKTDQIDFLGLADQSFRV
jgi:hypothetical protein